MFGGYKERDPAVDPGEPSFRTPIPETSHFALPMKTLRLFALSILGLPAFALAAPVDSHISAATVYSDRAVVTRIAEIDVSPGENALVFERLPAGLVDQSLQVSAHGTASATILDVSAEPTY